MLFLIVCKLQQECRWDLWICMHACMGVYVCLCIGHPIHLIPYISFATVLVTSWCLVTSNVSCFTVQAVVELLSLYGLSVVSGLLTQDPVKWDFSCFRPTYTRAQTSKHMPAHHIWDVKKFGSVVSPLVLWNGVHRTLWRCRGISLTCSLTEVCQDFPRA